MERTPVISLQAVLNHARRVVPRGWTPLIRALAGRTPALQRYRAQLKNGDFIYLDLRERMCFGLLYYGTQPQALGAEKLFRNRVNGARRPSR